MTRLAEEWKTIATHLGLEIVSPFRLTAPNGEAIEVDLLLRNFGAANGMLLVDDYSKVEKHLSFIGDMGYGFSTLSANTESRIPDLEVIREVLADWTWSGPVDEKPSWLPDKSVYDE